MTPPPRWTRQEIVEDCVAATTFFRNRRFAEPAEAWLREVDKRAAEFEKLFDLHGVGRPRDLTAEDIPEIIDADLLDALRYLPGPPISGDDLRNLAQVESLNPAYLRGDLKAAQRVLDVIRATVDPRRFPWLAANREPTAEERRTAIFASALLHAAPRVLSDRRNLSKQQQEAAVRGQLAEHGLSGKRLHRVASYADFPPRGIYSENEVVFGPKKADVLARLWDDRMLPVECKVSNSAVNSFKRLNHETLSKYYSWTHEFGTKVMPVAVLSGVFSPANVFDAQEAGLTIFWSHRLDDLGAFVESTKQ